MYPTTKLVLGQLRRGWWPAAIGFGVFVSVAAFGWAMSPADTVPISDWQVLIQFFVGVPAGIGGAAWTLIQCWRIHNRAIRAEIEAFKCNEHLLAVERCGHCPNFCENRSPWVWRQYIPGFVGLTERELIFRPSPLHSKHQGFRIDLTELDPKEPCCILVAEWLIKGQPPYLMKIEYREGPREFFGFNGNSDGKIDRFMSQIKSVRGKLPAES